MNILNERDSYTVQFALETAAKKYGELEQEARGQSKQAGDGFDRLAKQFGQQRADADRLCSLVAEHDGVALMKTRS